MRTIFSSKNSFEEAIYKARQQGFRVVSQARNPKTGLFVVFAESQNIRRYL